MIRVMVIVLTGAAGPLFAQHAHGAMGGGGPSEPGQGAFGALSEVVALLRADPATDWEQVDMAALRAHLMDMDALVRAARVQVTRVEGGVEMVIARDGPAGAAAGRMVPMHGPVLAAETGWTSSVELGETGIVWRVTSGADAAQIRGLGFFGLMALGAHHPVHHMMLARGDGH